jgi:hypothetical protein
MKIELFFQPENRLCAQIDDEKCVLGVKPVWAAPLSRSHRYLAILDPKGEDIVLLTEPKQELSEESWRVAQIDMRRRDLTSRIQSLESAREDGGAVYFSAQTDRGARDFVCTNLAANAIWFGEDRLLLVDAEGNRFEIESVSGLDTKSRTLIEGIL